LTTQQKTLSRTTVYNLHTSLLVRNNPTDFFVVVSLKLSVCTLAHNYSELCDNCLRGSNNSQTFFSNKVERKMQIRTNMLLQKGAWIHTAFVHNFW